MHEEIVGEFACLADVFSAASLVSGFEASVSNFLTEEHVWHVFPKDVQIFISSHESRRFCHFPQIERLDQGLFRKHGIINPYLGEVLYLFSSPFTRMTESQEFHGHY